MGYVDRRRAKYTAKWDVQMAGMNFQTRSIPYREKKERRFLCPHVCGRGEKRLAVRGFAGVVQNAARKILILSLPQRRISQMYGFRDAGIWYWIRTVK